MIQTSMDITGTTAKEAEHTISGSINSLQAAVKNLVVGFGDADADMQMLCENVVDAFQSVIENITPVMSEDIDDVMQGLAKDITNYTAEIIRSYVERIDVYKPEKVPGTRTKKQTICIHWNFIGAVDIPAEHEKTA